MAKVTFKGQPIATSGALPSLNSKTPDFQLVDKDLNNRSLKDYAGKRKLLSIVPSLDTSVCSAMAKKFNASVEGHPEVQVLVISADLPFAQKRFCSQENAHNIEPLSMMRSKDFAKDYGVLIVEGPLEGLCARAVVVLDEMDQVIYTQLVPEITKEPDYEKALEKLIG